MNTIELRLQEVLELQIELEGYINPQTGETIVKGFINHSLPLTTKFWLTKLTERVGKEKSEIEKMRNSLIEKFGDKDEQGNISIPAMVKKGKKEEPNPKLMEFQREYQNLLNETISIEYKPISLDTLENITTEDNYNILFKLVSE
jgi:hypothetical protein